MSKSLWSRSVWNSLFSRASTSKRIARKRRKVAEVSHQQMEALETRVLLTADVTFDSATNTLTVSDNNTVTNDNTITIKAGSSYTDILVNGKFQTRLTEATSENIGVINFDGDAGTDTLSVIGVNGPGGNVLIDLTATERLLLNTKNTIVESDIAFALGKSTVAGELIIGDVNGGGGTVPGLTQFGKVTVSGRTEINSAGVITLSSSGNSFGTLVLAGTNININEAGPTVLGETTASGSLTVKSTGSISDNGQLDVGTTTTLTASGAITLDDATSVFDGLMTLKGTNIQIDNNVPTILGAVTASGTFTLTSNGAVTHPSGNLKIGGLATISTDTPGTDDITLTAGTNNFGSISLFGDVVQVTEKSATTLDTTNATDLTVNAKGDITDAGEIIVTGDTVLTATGKAITLDESTSSYGNGVGDTLQLTGTNVSVVNSGSTDLAAVVAKGAFTLTSGGAVTQTAAIINSTGRTTIDATGTTITLNSANTVGSWSLFGTTVQVTETGGTNLFTSEVDDLTVAAGAGAVTDSGDITVANDTSITTTSTITLDQAGSSYGSGDATDETFLSAGGAASITTIEAIDFGTGTTAASLTVISDGAVTDDGTILLGNGKLTVTTPDSITLNGANTIGSIAVTGDAITINDTTNGLDIVSATAASTLSVTTAGGALTDSGKISVTDTTTLAAGAANDITLNTATNTFGDNVTITTGNNVTLVDSDSLGLGISGTAISGNLSLTANGDISDTGAALSVGTAGGAATTVILNAGSSGSISFTTTNFADEAINLTMTGVNATFTPTVAPAANARDVALGTTSLSGTLTMSNVSDVTDSGKITIGGTVSIDSFDDAVDVITLNSIGNTYGTLNLDAFDVTITEAAATDLGTVDADGALSVISSGDVTDSGNVTVTGASTVVSNGGNDIALDSAGNDFGGSLTLTGNDVTVVNTNATDTDLAAVNATGSFSLTSTGAVTDSGTVTVGGAATVSTAGAAAITLDSATNNFGSISTNGTAVTIREVSATNLGTTNATTLVVNSDGAITDSGTITASGAVTMTAGAGASNLDAITLDDASNTFGTLDLEGGNITLVENAATDFGDVDAAGTLNVTSAGAITQSAGELIIGGLATLVAYNGSANQNITLNTATNEFSSVSVTGADVTIRDADAIDFAAASVSGALTVTADGDVTDSGALTVVGLTTITTGTGDIVIDEAGGSFGSIDLNADDNIVFIAYSGLTIVAAETTNADITIIASGAITDDGAAATIDAGVNVFIQAGLDPNDPTRELDVLDAADAPLLNSLNLGATDPLFTGTETYVGSIVNVG